MLQMIKNPQSNNNKWWPKYTSLLAFVAFLISFIDQALAATVIYVIFVSFPIANRILYKVLNLMQIVLLAYKKP